jgi:hypothetical protein
MNALSGSIKVRDGGLARVYVYSLASEKCKAFTQTDWVASPLGADCCRAWASAVKKILRIQVL